MTSGLEVNDFCRWLANGFGLDPDIVLPESKLIFDLELDPVAFLKFEVLLSEMADGFVLPEQFARQDISVRDAHYYYRLFVTSRE
jgi:hypothetical protein